MNNIFTTIQRPTFNDVTIRIPNSYIFSNNIQLPLVNIDRLKILIEQTLAGLDGVRFSYNKTEHSGWKIEYGTRPLMKSNFDYSMLKIINKKQNAAIESAIRAIEWFPHNFPTNESVDYIYELMCSTEKKWFEGRIWLSYDIEKNIVFIEQNREYGDSVGFYYIKNVLDDVLKNKKNIHWLTRVDYVMFMEGIHYDYDNPTLRFLCDEFVCRDISSYL
jgi:hypothetical protein